MKKDKKFIIAFLIMIFLNLYFLFINQKLIKQINYIKKENEIFRYKTQDFFLDFSEVINLKVNKSLYVYKTERDSTIILDFIDESKTYIYIDESNCSKCIVELKEFATRDIVYIVYYKRSKWGQWLMSSILKNQEVYYLKRQLSESLRYRSPLLMKFNNCCITKIAPVSYNTSFLATTLFFHEE